MNRGDEDAFNVEFRLLTPEGEEARNPSIHGDYPIEILRAGTEVSFLAAVSMGGGRASVAEISWEDNLGKHSVRQSISI